MREFNLFNEMRIIAKIFDFQKTIHENIVE